MFSIYFTSENVMILACLRCLFSTRFPVFHFSVYNKISEKKGGVSENISFRYTALSYTLLFSYLVEVFTQRFIERLYYSIISVTTPEPTVLPPSLIANLCPSSIATLWISSISITMLSPGIHISVPAGRFNVPVISVVLK